MVARIIPRLIRGRLLFEVGPVLLPSFAAAASAWSELEADRAAAMELQLKAKHEAQATPSAPLRRCDDCQLNLGTRPGDTLLAAFVCPRFGKPRAGIETHCMEFRRKLAGGAS